MPEPAKPAAPKAPEPPKPAPTPAAAAKPVDPPKPVIPKAAEVTKTAMPKMEEHHDERKSPSCKTSIHHRTHHPSPRPCDHRGEGVERSETQRLQWEMTERALAKNDDGPFKKFGGKFKGFSDK